MTFAIGFFSAFTNFTGSTLIDDGDMPKVHMSASPLTTGFAMPRP